MLTNRKRSKNNHGNNTTLWTGDDNFLENSFDGCFQWKGLSQQYKSLRELTLSIVF